jgi:hypothetical protein
MRHLCRQGAQQRRGIEAIRFGAARPTVYQNTGRIQNPVVDASPAQQAVEPEAVMARFVAGHHVHRTGQSGLGLIALACNQREWQTRRLEALYALVFFDAIRVNVRDEGTVRNKAVYLALGVRPDGAKEILGLWIEQSEGAKFWLRVMNELRACRVEDVHDGAFHAFSSYIPLGERSSMNLLQLGREISTTMLNIMTGA